MSDLLFTALKGAVLGGAGLVGVVLVTVTGRMGLWLLWGAIRLVREFRQFLEWRRRGVHEGHGQTDDPESVAVLD